MSTVVGASNQHRSPQGPHATTGAPTSGSIPRRRHITPVVVSGRWPGFAPDDPDLRRFWVAAIGAGAVEDLLRLIAAGRRRVTIAEPLFLPVLIHEGLAASDGQKVLVPSPVPPLGYVAARRLPAGLRVEHADVIRARANPGRSATR